MYGKCQNCGELNYLTRFKVNGKHVCPKCLGSSIEVREELERLQENALERQKLRKAFGKIGE